MKESFAITFLVGCLLVLTVWAREQESKASYEIVTTNIYTIKDSHADSTYILIRPEGSVHLFVHNKEAGEFFVVLSNKVWTIAFTNSFPLRPVSLQAKSNLLSAITNTFK